MSGDESKPGAGNFLLGEYICPQSLMPMRLQLTASLDSSEQSLCSRQLCKPSFTAWLERHCHRRLSDDALAAAPPPLAPQHSAREAQAAVELGVISHSCTPSSLVHQRLDVWTEQSEQPAGDRQVGCPCLGAESCLRMLACTGAWPPIGRPSFCVP